MNFYTRWCAEPSSYPITFNPKLDRSDNNCTVATARVTTSSASSSFSSGSLSSSLLTTTAMAIHGDENIDINNDNYNNDDNINISTINSTPKDLTRTISIDKDLLLDKNIETIIVDEENSETKVDE